MPPRRPRSSLHRTWPSPNRAPFAFLPSLTRTLEVAQVFLRLSDGCAGIRGAPLCRLDLSPSPLELSLALLRLAVDGRARRLPLLRGALGLRHSLQAETGRF